MAIFRSFLALGAGAVVVVALSMGTDLALQHSILPKMNTPDVTRPLLGLALLYRAIYGIVGGWVAAKLAPRKPTNHAIALGAIGMIVAGTSIFTTQAVGHEWYPIALALLAIPETWTGAKLAGDARRPRVEFRLSK